MSGYHSHTGLLNGLDQEEKTVVVHKHPGAVVDHAHPEGAHLVGEVKTDGP